MTGHLLGHQDARRINAVERADHETHIPLVAHQRRQTLVAGQGRPDHQAQTQRRPHPVAPQMGQYGTGFKRSSPDPPHGRSSNQHHTRRELPRHQIAHFARIGVHDIGQHGGIDHRTVLPHEVAVERRHQHQHRGDRTVQPGPMHQPQQRGRTASHHQAQGQDHASALRQGLIEHQQPGPQRPVADCGDPQRQGPHQAPGQLAGYRFVGRVGGRNNARGWNGQKHGNRRGAQTKVLAQLTEPTLSHA